MVRAKQTVKVEWMWMPDGVFPYGTGEDRLVHVSQLRKVVVEGREYYVMRPGGPAPYVPAVKTRRKDYVLASSPSSTCSTPSVKKVIAKGRRRLLARSSSSSSAASVDSGALDVQLRQVRVKLAGAYARQKAEYSRQRALLQEAVARKLSDEKIKVLEARKAAVEARVVRALRRHRKQEECNRLEEEERYREVEANYEKALETLESISYETTSSSGHSDLEVAQDCAAILSHEISDTSLCFLHDTNSVSLV